MSLDGEKRVFLNRKPDMQVLARVGWAGNPGLCDHPPSSMVNQPALLPDRGFRPCRLVASSPGALRLGTPAGCWTTSWPPSCTAPAAWPMSRVQAACPTSSTISSLGPRMASTRAWPSAGTGDQLRDRALGPLSLLAARR